MLTVDAPVGLGLIFDLFVFVTFNEILRDDMAELAWMKRSSPLRRVLMLELERLVEHFPYAWRTYWTAVDVGAGVVTEVLAANLAVPEGSHIE